MSGAGAAPFAPPIIEALQRLPAETAASIVDLVVRTYPQGGAQHEPAIRMAAQLGWAVCHHLTQPGDL